MKRYLLDTNVLSEVMKKRPAASVVAELDALAPEQLTTSAICVMELRFGAVRHRDAKGLWARIESDVLRRVEVIPFATEEAGRAGELLAALERRGTPIGTEDVLIGATALVHGLTVATRNVEHLGRIEGLDVVNWW
jgi:predicted nucleic acid-binding protein